MPGPSRREDDPEKYDRETARLLIQSEELKIERLILSLWKGSPLTRDRMLPQIMAKVRDYRAFKPEVT